MEVIDIMLGSLLLMSFTMAVTFYLLDSKNKNQDQA